MRDGKMISGFFQHIECIQIAGRQKLPSEEVFMEIKNYYELAKNDTLLIADERSLRVIFNLGHERLITNIYKKVYVTPEIYNSIVKVAIPIKKYNHNLIAKCITYYLTHPKNAR